MAKRIIIFILSMLPLSAVAQTGALPTQLCVQAGVQAKVSGLNSSNYLDGVIPYCTVTIYLTGTTTKATIYADSSNTPLTNPFTARSNGQFLVFAAVNQGYDVVLSGGIPPNNYVTPLTLTDIYPSTQFTSTGITSITGVNGYDCTTGSCNISGQSVDFEINGSQASSQILRNFVDGANTTVVDNGGGSYEVDASGGSLVNAVTIPDGTGQHIILWATNAEGSGVFGHASVIPFAPGGVISMGDSPGDCFGAYSCQGTLNLSGYTLSGTGLTCANVTSVRPFLIASLNANVPKTISSSPGETFSPSLDGPFAAQFTGDTNTTITCADIGSAGISIQIGDSAGVPFAPVIANAFGAGLIVEYSGSPVPQPTSIGVYSPLYVDGAGSLHLSPINLGSQGDGGVLGTLGLVNGGGGATTAPAILANLLGNPSANTYSINCTSTTNCVPVTGGGGSVSSVANSDGTLTVTPTTGAVVASLALGNANTWTGKQTQPAPVFSDLTGSTQCLHVNSAGQVSGTGTDCGAGGSSAFNAITSGTNTTATMVVGSGASLTPTGTGAIQATNIASTVTNGANVTITGSGTTASPYVIAAAAAGTGISGLTAGYLPLAGSATTITSNSNIDDGVTTASVLTAHEPIAVSGSSQGVQLNGALTAVAGIANYATYLADSSGKPEARTGTGSPSLLCTAANIGSADCPVSGGGGGSGPTLKQYTYFNSSTYSSPTSSVTTPAITTTTGDLVVVACGGGSTTTVTFTVTDSLSNSWNSTALQQLGGGTNIAFQAYWSIISNSGSTTFTCANSGSTPYPGMVVMEFSGAGSTINNSANLVSPGTSTIYPNSTRLATSQRTLNVLCMRVNSGSYLFFPGLIGGAPAYLAGIDTGSFASNTSTLGCSANSTSYAVNDLFGYMNYGNLGSLQAGLYYVGTLMGFNY